MTVDPDVHQALSVLLPELHAAPDITLDRNVLSEWSHRRVFAAVLDGKIPAERINGRWYFRRADRQRIAEVLAITPKPRMGRPPQGISASSSLARAA